MAENVALELSVFNAARVVCVDDLEEGVDELALDRNLQLGDQVGDFVDGEVAALVEVEVVEDLLEELRVLTGELPNARLNLAEEVRDGLLGDSGVLLLGNLPGGLHHGDEVLVAGGAHGQVSVVIVPLGLADSAVVVTACAIKVVEEVGEDLLTRLTALKELRVHAHIVDVTNVLDVDDTGAITVHHSESLVDHSLTTRRKLVPKFKFNFSSNQVLRAFLRITLIDSLIW